MVDGIDLSKRSRDETVCSEGTVDSYSRPLLVDFVTTHVTK